MSKNLFYDTSDKKNSFYYRLYMIGIMLIALIDFIYQLKLFGLLAFLYFIYGSSFFFGGLYACMSDRKHGIVLLFTHGFIGYLLMMSTFPLCKVSKLEINNTAAILSDISPSIIIMKIIWVILIIIISIIGFAYEIKYNSNDTFRKKKHAMFVPISFFTVAFFLASILPIIMDIIT